MNQLFYNIAGGIVHQIRCENGQQHQKWLFAVSEISEIGIGFISIFLLKARVLYLTILQWKSLSLPLKVDTDQFVICLVLPECLPVKIQLHFTLRQWSESWRRWCRLFFFVVFSLFFASFKSSRPREKVGNWSSFFAVYSRHQRALSRFGARLRILNLIAWLC